MIPTLTSRPRTPCSFIAMSPARQDQLSSILSRASRTFLAAKRQLLYVSSSILPKLGRGRVQPGEILRLSCHVPELRLFLFNQAHQRYSRDARPIILYSQYKRIRIKGIHFHLLIYYPGASENQNRHLSIARMYVDLSWRLCRFRCRYASGIKLQPYYIANTILKLPILGQC